jgi:hypothetical protein
MMACENDLNDARAKVFDKQSRLAAAVHERSVFRKRKLNLPLDVDIGNFCKVECDHKLLICFWYIIIDYY